MHPGLRERLAKLDAKRAATRSPTLLLALLDADMCSWHDIAPTWHLHRRGEAGARLAAGALPHVPPEQRPEVFQSLLAFARSRRWDPFSLPLVAPALRSDERATLLDALLDAGRAHDVARLAPLLDVPHWRRAYALVDTLSDCAALWVVAPASDRRHCMQELRERLLAHRLDIASGAHSRVVATFVAELGDAPRTQILQRVLSHSDCDDGSAGSALRWFGHLVNDKTLPQALPLLDAGAPNPTERAQRRLFLAQGQHAQAAVLRSEAIALADQLIGRDPGHCSGRDLDLLLDLARTRCSGHDWQSRAATIVACISPEQDEDCFEPIHWDHLLPRVAPERREQWLVAIDRIPGDDYRDEALAAACRHWRLQPR